VRLTFRHRLFLGLTVLGTVPLAAAMVTLALYVRSTASPAGPRAALDSITVSGRAVITAVDTAALPDSARAALRRHAETIAHGTTLAHRAETLSRFYALFFGAALLFAAAVAVGLSTLLVRRWSAQVSAPIEELVDWTRKIQRGEPLPGGGNQSVAPELGALRDALREMAAALEEARRQEVERERLQAFRETARRVAHEMRGPLNAAQLALGRLAAQPDPNSEQARQVLAEETGRLKAMADEFAAFGRLPEGPESEIDMAELIESVLAATVPATCPVGQSLEPGLRIRGRYEALRRAVQNVVRNAVQAADSRGIAISASRDGGDVVCVVMDHGSGIPAELRRRLFQPYATTKLHGTGLGLAIAHQAVTAHGGTLTAQDTAGGGATFVFRFPAA
jgi:signal transduction histidine kinase